LRAVAALRVLTERLEILQVDNARRKSGSRAERKVGGGVIYVRTDAEDGTQDV
jgi:hypothetical protein